MKSQRQIEVEKELDINRNRVYETSTLLVYHNDSGEVFVKHKKSGHELRIGDYLDDIMITTNHCVLTPTNINGVNGVKTYPKASVPGYIRKDSSTCPKCGTIVNILDPCPNCDSGF